MFDAQVRKVSMLVGHVTGERGPHSGDVNHERLLQEAASLRTIHMATYGS